MYQINDPLRGEHKAEKGGTPRQSKTRLTHFQMIGLAILREVVSRASRAVGEALSSLRRLLEESFINRNPSSGRKIDQ